LLKEGKVKEYTRCVAQDQSMGIEAARTLLPAGWTCQGQVAWNMQSGRYPAIISLVGVSPDHRANITYLSGLGFEEPHIFKTPMWTKTEAQLYREGGTTEKGNPMLRLMKPDDFAVYIVGRLFNAQDIKITKSYPISAEARAAMDKANAQQLAALRQQAQSIPGTTFPAATLDRGVVDITAVQNGKRYKCSVASTITSSTLGFGQRGYYQETTIWQASDITIITMEADASEAPVTAAVPIFMSNFVPNQQWQQSLTKAIGAIGQQRNAELKRQGEAAVRAIQQQARMNAQSSQQNYGSSVADSIAHRADVNSKVMAGWDDTISGVDNYRAPDGGVMKVDMNYDHVYSTPSGKIIATQGVKLDNTYGEFTPLKKLPSVLP